MFCPKCGVNNLDDAKFCRTCGADIHLVPQALAGGIPEGAYGVLEVQEEEKEGRRERTYKFTEPPTLEKGLENIFIGVAFFIIFMLGLVYFRGAFTLWVWLIIPSLACVGDGIGRIIRSRRNQTALPPAAAAFRPETLIPPARPSELPAADTSEIIPPRLSVTENTTRHLNPPAERVAKDA